MQTITEGSSTRPAVPAGWQAVHPLHSVPKAAPQHTSWAVPTMGCTISGVGRNVRAFRAPPAPPSSSSLLPCSRAGVEQLLRCSSVSRSQGSEHRKDDGPNLHFRPAPSPTAAVFPSPSSWLCLSHSSSSRAEEQDRSGRVGSLCISLVFWYFLARLSVACYIYQRVSV